MKKSTAQRAMEISKDLNIPYGTVETIIKMYLESLTESVMNGEDIILKGVFRINITEREDGSLRPMGKVSSALREKLRRKEARMRSV